MAADLRRDCREALDQDKKTMLRFAEARDCLQLTSKVEVASQDCHTEAERHAAERWRGLRVRHQLLRDMYLASNALHGWQLLSFAACNAMDFTVYGLLLLREAVRASGMTKMMVFHTLSFFCSVLGLVTYSLVEKWARVEVNVVMSQGHCHLTIILWFSLPGNVMGTVAVIAPRLDLELLKTLASSNELHLKAALQKMCKHLWYLSETMPLALFDKDVSLSDKRDLVQDMRFT
ncbi:hypothetical protein ONE63_004522 [Megalurothrips usitatus]|uniref:Uncharacterized protein n=1 Tax=Megalurothrips usitatus TaxID=439358 RepID=A0AAV7X674_9NEOP|nr:hypothetical protein ONE63_004522 [Megalurothrips usitatus]